ncbi:MAG TPA: hypothetical protein VKT99_08525 [Xanthobacteraceae bacterium]|nr:hypothetical protein [Xanthobacteraceae bacterium]
MTSACRAPFAGSFLLTKLRAEVGWAGLKKGELPQLAATQFDILLTVDRNLEYQQNFAGLALAVIIVHASSNDVTMLRPLMSAVLAAIPKTQAG